MLYADIGFCGPSSICVRAAVSEGGFSSAECIRTQWIPAAFKRLLLLTRERAAFVVSTFSHPSVGDG